ncbi:unnamed protein product, partial [Mesorhabditis belari]|uniref:Uncharacterized protein n=1 Tax=Mesorhabditis belari TaxID=2138241 RepID=A0AAF3EYM4_9BILA
MKIELLNEKVKYVQNANNILRNRIYSSQKIIRDQTNIKRVLYNRLIAWDCKELYSELVLPFDTAPIVGIDVIPHKKIRLQERASPEEKPPQPQERAIPTGKENSTLQNVLYTQAKIEAILADCKKQSLKNISYEKRILQK